MPLKRKGKGISVDEEDFNIYVADELCTMLRELCDTGEKELVLDLKKVERLSTPGLQVILSARKSFPDFSIKGISKALSDQVGCMDLEL